MTNLRKAVVLSLLQRYVAFIIQFVSSMVMARLLNPHETGIFSLAAAVIGIASMLRDFGVGEYVVQEKELTHERLRSALGITILIAWVLAACVYFLAAPLAVAYKEVGIERVLHVLVLNFLLLPLGSTTFAVLTREMAFKAIFWVQSISAAVGAIVGIWLAYRGFSYMSMAWASLASIAATVAMLTTLRPKEALMLPRFTGLGRVGRFGGTLTIGRLMDQATRRLPDFMIASGLGLRAVGINSKASSLLDAFQDFFTSGINRVALPAFSKNLQEQSSGHDDYLRGIRLISVVPLFFFSFLAIFSEPIIYLVFGPTWLEVVPLLRISGIGGILAAPYYLAPPVLTANGQIKDILLIQLLGGAVVLAGIWATSGISLVAIAWSGVFSSLVKLVLFQKGLRKGLQLRFIELLQATWPGFIAASVAYLCSTPMLLLYQHSTASALLVVAAGGAITVVIGFVMGHFLKHPLFAEINGMLRRRA